MCGVNFCLKRASSEMSQKTIAFALLLLLISTVLYAEEIEFSFASSYDKSEQTAAAYIPETCKTRDKNPLLVIVHYMGGNRYTARNLNYYPECDARGYLLVCPELHGHKTGGATSLASLEAQHDVIDAINFMKERYSVDTSRIYIAGRSMGGMLAQIMAAKYPDLFAAAVSGEGISDLPLWYKTSIPSLIRSVEQECGPYSETTRFNYERRSSVSFASNLKYVPLILWHGTNDTWVPPEQSELIVKEVKKFNRFQPDVHWLHCAPHCPANFTAKWVCDQFTYYQNVCESGFDTPTRFFPELTITTDEAKNFYWLGITPSNKNSFAHVKADLSNDLLFVRTENVREVSVNLDQVSKQLTFSKFDVKGDTELKLFITKGGKTLVDITAKGRKKGTLPNSLFTK